MRSARTMFMLVIALTVGYTLAQDRITVWTHFGDAEMAFLEEQAQSFEEATGASVTIVEMPFGDILQNFLLAAPEGDAADLLVTIPHDWVGELAAAGVLEPMDRHVDSALLDDWQESGVQAFSYQGRLFGYPMSAESLALIYNRELVESAPETWDELMAIAEEQTDAGNFGLLYNFAEPYFNAGWWHAYGAEVFATDEDGALDPDDIRLGGEPGYQAAQFVQDLRWTYNLVPEGVDYDVANSAFLDGVLAMIINGPWALGDYRAEGIDFGIAPVPPPPGAEDVWRPFIGVHGLGVNAYSPSERRDLAVAFAEQLASAEGQLAFNRASGRIPVSEGALAELGDDEVVQGFSEVIEVGVPMPNIPEMGRVWGPWGNALELVGQSPDVDVEATIDDLEAQLE